MQSKVSPYRKGFGFAHIDERLKERRLDGPTFHWCLAAPKVKPADWRVVDWPR